MGITRSLTGDQVRYLRQRAQKLTPQQTDIKSSIAHLVRDLGGIQAQDIRAASLAIRARSTGLHAADVEYTRTEERSIIRTWGLRGTLHLLATEDLDWLLPLLGPVFVAGDRRRRTELGLDEDTCIRGMQIIRNILANQGPLTRDELIEQLAMRGLQLTGQARPHLLSRAALEGIICFGPDRDGKSTYVLLDDWISQKERSGHSLTEIAAHAELTRRYLRAYGPATPLDQAAWSGMPISQTRAAWQHLVNELLEVDIDGSPAWMLKTDATRLSEQPAAPLLVRLLPAFDIYLLGYRQRDLIVPSPYTKRINAGGGLLHPVVLVNGQVAGTWKYKQQKNRLEAQVEPFNQLSPEVSAGIETETNDLARFLELQRNEKQI